MPGDFVADDLTNIFVTDEFGTTVVVGGSPQRTIVGIFDKDVPYDVDMGGYTDFESSNPRLTIQTSDLGDIARGTELEIDSTTYEVRSVYTQIDNITILELKV